MGLSERQSGFTIPTDPAYYTWSVQRQLTAIDLSLMLVALVCVLMRIYIRVVHLGVFRLDDYFMVAAMICSVVSCSIFYHVIQLGMGKHIFAIPVQNTTPLYMWVWIVGVIIPFSVFFVKMSVAFFLLPLTRRSPYRVFLWSMIVFLIALMIFVFVTIMLGCIPVEANWDFTLRPPPIGKGSAKCLTLDTFRNFAMFNTITNIITDFALAIFPVPLIWTLQVNRRTKASLIFILSLGFFACAAGIIKAPLLFHFFDDIDATGDRSWYYAWQIIEMNIGIIAATLPSLKPAFRWLLETAKTLATGVSGNRTGHSHAYKRQSSSGYLRHKESSGSHVYSYGRANRTGAIEDPVDMELKGLGPYNVTVAGRGSDMDVESGSNESRESGRGRKSYESADQIMRVGLEDGKAMDRRIVKTTKVTIVTS